MYLKVLTFLYMVIKGMATDGVTPFIIVLSVAQFMVASKRVWGTLGPALWRLFTFSGRCIYALMQQKYQTSQTQNREVERLSSDGAWAKTTFGSCKAGDIVKVEVGHAGHQADCTCLHTWIYVSMHMWVHMPVHISIDVQVGAPAPADFVLLHVVNDNGLASDHTKVGQCAVYSM